MVLIQMVKWMGENIDIWGASDERYKVNVETDMGGE